MGASQSQATYNKISQTLPQVQEHGWDTNSNKWTGGSVKAFRNEDDRTQFIHSLITLISSNNGTIWLENHDYKLLFSRQSPSTTSTSSSSSSPPEQDDIIASLIAINTTTLIIDAKISPPSDGPEAAAKTQAEAFKQFKTYVERRLHEVLKGVPDATASAAAASVTSPPRRGSRGGRAEGGASSIETSSPVTSPASNEQPPAYEANQREVFVGGGAKRL